MAGKFEIYENRAGKYTFRLKASNGQIVANGETYETKAAAKKACESVQRAALDAKTDTDLVAVAAAEPARAAGGTQRPSRTAGSQVGLPAADAIDAGGDVREHDPEVLTRGAERREAVTEALASVRAEGLEPTIAGLALLEAVASGHLNEDEAIETLGRQHRS